MTAPSGDSSPYDVLVAGSGVMGRGIAASFAAAGLKTAVLSRDPSRVQGPQHAAVALLGELPAEPPRLIVETIVEEREAKRALFARIESRYGGAPVVGSNTSSLPLQELADGLKHPAQFCGIHYFQPADVTRVVEVARLPRTSDAALETALSLLRQAEKAPVLLTQPVPGLLINRLQHAILSEAYHLIEAGVVSAADVDLAAKELLGPRMSVTGLIEQKDLSGLDTHAVVQRELVPELCHSATPNPLPQRLAGLGHIGAKSGTGFYDWRQLDLATYTARTRSLLGAVQCLLDDRPPPPPLAPPASEGDR